MATSGLVVLPEEPHQHALGTEKMDETQRGLMATEKGLACICSKRGHFRRVAPSSGPVHLYRRGRAQSKGRSDHLDSEEAWTLDDDAIIPVIDIPDS